MMFHNEHIVCYSCKEEYVQHTHVRFSASDGRNGDPRVDDTRYVEVGEVNVATRVQQHVGWFDVAMDDTVLSEVL